MSAVDPVETRPKDEELFDLTELSEVTENNAISKVAVLGAGVMGAQIAAHFANRGICTLLFDLAGQKLPNQLAQQALDKLKKINPQPLACDQAMLALSAHNFDDDLGLLTDCDLVIEVIAERLDLKQSFYQKIETYLGPKTIVASNTSGLSIEALAESWSADVKTRFCGVHFFNPPRYMPLVELIPTSSTDPAILDHLETFLVGDLGKTVVRGYDTPNFIANRVGVFAMLAAIHYTQNFQLGLDTVDALTGKRIGRAKSATYRTADLVGLDVLSHVVQTMSDKLNDDPWANYYELPAWFKGLIDQGALGQKTRCGLYQKVDGEIHVYHWAKGIYAPGDSSIDAAVKRILKQKNVAKKLAALRASDHPQAQFLWSVFREVFHYCAVIAADIAHCVRDIDQAMRCGFGWQEGPFELWQQAGWQQVITWIDEDIAAGKTLARIPLPKWVRDLGDAGVYSAEGAFNPSQNSYQQRSTLPVYRRQLYPKAFLNESFDWGKTLFENEGARVWECGDGLVVISFKTKLGTIGSAVLEGLTEAINIAETHYDGLIIWQADGENFSAGADLRQFSDVMIVGGDEVLDQTLDFFQQTLLALRYARVPVIAAIRGYIFGGGCELMMHCDRVVAALESYVGLVEVGVGIIPAAGGCKEMALRAQQSDDPEKVLQNYYRNIAMAEVAKSAYQAQAMGYLRPQDVVIFNPDELLFVAKSQARLLIDSHYRPPLKPVMTVAGEDAYGTLMMMVTNLNQGGYASDHDYQISDRLAQVMTGGSLTGGAEVDEGWYLSLERQHFLNLVKNKKSQARMIHMLKTGKPLRN